MATADECGEAKLRAGTNYLGQALRPAQAGLRIVLPAEQGASVVRHTATASTVLETAVQACEADGVTILAMAWSSPASELLALAHSGVQGVQVWRLSTGDESTLAATIELPGICRQLCWHPYRRLLAAALPDRVMVVEVGAGTKSAPKAHTLRLPEGAVGAVSSTVWGSTGGVLAAACEREVILFHWAIAGAGWERCTTVRHPVPHRRLCTLHPLEARDDDDDDDDQAVAAGSGLSDAFVLGLGIPIVTGDGADLSAAGSPRLLAPGADADAPALIAPTTAPELLDLRGRIGAQDGARSLLDLSDELEALRPQPPVALRDINQQE